MRGKVVGITGPSGAGKSEVAAVFGEMGAAVFDGDRAAHDFMMPGQPCFDEVVAEFGDGILSDGRIDRKKLGEIVFGNRANLVRLTNITNEYLFNAAAQAARMEEYGCRLIVLDAAVLFEAGLHELCDHTIGVFASENTRLGRIVARDNIAPEAARARMGSQTGQSEIAGRVDFAIENDGDRDELVGNVREIIGKIMGEGA
ncbi:MAG: dephospho-CoA kinase [Defluviitaleaceae bacterium]|nr:dephospho-CoA kinase [Defluviitaleaceae bacterium]